MNKLIALMSGLFERIKHGGSELNSGGGSRPASMALNKVLGLTESFFLLLSHVSFKGFIITGMLLLVIVLSAIGVVYSSHLSRQLFADQAILLEKNDQMQLEWAQLLLEQSAWSSPNRIESVANEKLGMDIPNTEDIQLIY
jgi:cell division protein FtsL